MPKDLNRIRASMEAELKAAQAVTNTNLRVRKPKEAKKSNGQEVEKSKQIKASIDGLNSKNQKIQEANNLTSQKVSKPTSQEVIPKIKKLSTAQKGMIKFSSFAKPEYIKILGTLSNQTKYTENEIDICDLLDDALKEFCKKRGLL